VTPLVRRMAAEQGVDLSAITGTGVGGRIRKQDVIDAAKAAKARETAPAPAAAPTSGAPAETKAHKPVNVDGRKVPGILLIDETLDAATPFPGSLEVRKRFPNSSLIAEPGGTTHAGTLYGNACVDGQIADYLLTGKLPARKPGNRPDTLCDPLPQPDPTATAGAAATTAAAGSTSVTTGAGRSRPVFFPVTH